VILLLLVTSITSDIVAPETTHHDGGIVAGAVLVGRYILQMVRLVKLLIESKRALEVSKHQNISLSESGEEEAGDTSH
jgi:hypothetical protein